jgi:hypothetical protein
LVHRVPGPSCPTAGCLLRSAGAFKAHRV